MEEETRQVIIDAAQELAGLPKEIALIIANGARDLEASEHYSRLIEEAEGIDTVVRLLGEHSRHERVALAGVQRFEYLRVAHEARNEGRCATWCARALRVNAPGVLLSCMRCHPRNALVTEMALKLLSIVLRKCRLGTIEASSLVSFFSSQQCMQTVLCALETFPSNKEIPEFGFHIFWMVIQWRVIPKYRQTILEYMENILQTNALPLAVARLTKVPTIPSSAWTFINTILNLKYLQNNPDVRELFGDDIIDKQVELFKNSPDFPMPCKFIGILEEIRRMNHAA